MAAMNMFGKLVALMLANQNFADNSRLIRGFLSNLATILILLLILTMMVGTLVVGGLYTGYLSLLANGWTTYEALSLLGSIIFVLVLALSALLIFRLKQLKTVPRQFIYIQPPFTNRLLGIGQAFVNGLMQKP